jgi:hypothetical protein
LAELEGKVELGKSGSRREDNIETDLKERGNDGED